ncbi:MAG: GrdX protein [Firmicutes bacterium]|nr:GrdX protein [Bacillota bacterium]
MFIVITNNPLVAQWYKDSESDNFSIQWQRDSLLSVLTTARDLIHQGWKLVNHPLASSIKPNQTPFKTLLLGKTKHTLDYQSLQAIEDAFGAVAKSGPFPGANEDVLADLQLLDLEICKSIELPSWEE